VDSLLRGLSRLLAAGPEHGPARLLAVRARRAAGRLVARVPALGRLREQRVPDTSRFMDYGPDWPPAPRPAPVRHPLLRRCVAAVVLYALIWALGSILLQVRLYQLHDFGGMPFTTSTTVSPHHGHD